MKNPKYKIDDEILHISTGNYGVAITKSTIVEIEINHNYGIKYVVRNKDYCNTTVLEEKDVYKDFDTVLRETQELLLRQRLKDEEIK